MRSDASAARPCARRCQKFAGTLCSALFTRRTWAVSSLPIRSRGHRCIDSLGPCIPYNAGSVRPLTQVMIRKSRRYGRLDKAAVMSRHYVWKKPLGDFRFMSISNARTVALARQGRLRLNNRRACSVSPWGASGLVACQVPRQLNPPKRPPKSASHLWLSRIDPPGENRSDHALVSSGGTRSGSGSAAAAAPECCSSGQLASMV